MDLSTVKTSTIHIVDSFTTLAWYSLGMCETPVHRSESTTRKRIVTGGWRLIRQLTLYMHKI
ncbi:hypothetical protein FHX15_004988 [Rhizobium sp. BK650]|nr:hypothetical protein [Rhizobium sp. BK650]